MDAHIFPCKVMDSWFAGIQKTICFTCIHSLIREIPYDTIDMDFMNENQAAHGDREFGHIFSRLHMERKVIVGYWEDEAVQKKIGFMDAYSRRCH